MHRIFIFQSLNLGIYYPRAYFLKARLPGAPQDKNVRFKNNAKVESSQEPAIRKNFPESWLYESINKGNGTEYVERLILCFKQFERKIYV